MADKIDSLKINNSSGTAVSYDIDLPPDATPSIASLTASGAITGGSIVKSGGTSAQFLKADGSVDSNTYLTSADNQKIKVGSTTFGANDEINLVGGNNITITPATTGDGAPKITITAAGGGTATDVQINGTSIVSGGVANIITNSAYNSSSNKVATMSDLPTVNNGTLSIQGSGTTASTFTANQSGNTTLNIKGGGYTTVTKSANNEITISSTGDGNDNTWRNVKVDNDEKLGTGTGTGALNFISQNTNNGDVSFTYSSGIKATAKIPTSLKNPNNFNVKANSDTSNLIEYDGSAAKTLTVKASSTAGAFELTDGTTTKTIQLAGTFTDNNYYPTTFAWTNGTTAGPTGSLTGTGMSAVSFGAIPSASYNQSGIITTDYQTISGTKALYGGGLAFTNSDYTQPKINVNSTEYNFLNITSESSGPNITQGIKFGGSSSGGDSNYIATINTPEDKKLIMLGYTTVSSTTTAWSSYLKFPQGKGTSSSYDTIAVVSDIPEILDLR